jgi:hypothetical protein
LTLDAFWQARREEQIVFLVYAQERDLEEIELSGAQALGNLEVVGTPVKQERDEWSKS